MNTSASAVATPISRVISPMTAKPAGPRGIGSAGTTRPKNASPFGRPSTSSRTRTVCTMAMARISPPSSLDNAITWAIEPGLAPNSAESGSQRCTTRRYVIVATIMPSEASIKRAMLTGQVGTPRSVSGVTTVPSSVPTTT
jgi:hypothetical protein